MKISLIWVVIAVAAYGSVVRAQWPPLRAAGLLGTENRGNQEARGQPTRAKKPVDAPTVDVTPAAPKADKPVGEGSFDDFGFGPDTGGKSAAPAAGADAGKAAEKASPSTATKPQAGAVMSKPIGPVRLTARSEPLPRLIPVTVAMTAVAPVEMVKEAGKAAAKPESEAGFVKGRRVK